MSDVNYSPLGKKTAYISRYQRDLLFPIPRKLKRDEIAVPQVLPFVGADIWNGFEISWLDQQGKPRVAMGEFVFPCFSPNIVESKSFKLYLNSFNNSTFPSITEVEQIMQRDLSDAVMHQARVKLILVGDFSENNLSVFPGESIDHLNVACDTYHVNPEFLSTTENSVNEILCSDLLKSNCLVTGQPDWGSLQISYTGNQIDREGLLKYIVSFRDHNEFHEQCVERIFMDMMRQCAPQKLSIYARYTRRGGLDINPYRSTEKDFNPANARLCRQ